MAKTRIQWTGDNLREVIGFTGLHPRFGDWFGTFEEYEQYVREHGSVFKLYLQDGKDYYLVYPGCTIERDDEKVINQCYPVTEGRYRLKRLVRLV